MNEATAGERTRSGLPGLGTAAAALVSAHFCVDLYAGYAAPLQRVFHESWELPLWATSLLVLPGSLMVLLQPLLGLLSDRLRTRAFVVVGVLLVLAGYGAALPLATLFGRSGGYPLALAAVLAGAAGLALYHPQGAALTGLSAGAAGRGRAVSFFVFAGSAGYAAGLFVPPLLFPDRIPWAACLTVLGLAVLVWQTSVPRLRPAGERLGRLELRGLFRQLADDVRPVRNELLLHWLAAMLRAAMLMVFTQLISIHYGKASGFGQLGGAALLAGFYLAQAVLGLGGAAAAARWGDRPMLGLSFLGGGALLAMGVLLSRQPGCLAVSCVAVIAGGGLLGSTLPVSVAAAQRLLGRSEALASGMIIGFAWGTGGLLVPLLAWLGDFLGAPDASLLGAAALALPAAALVWKLPRRAQ
jgi:FSR family fosmidomycin resistance protein-like MFS transporter